MDKTARINFRLNVFDLLRIKRFADDRDTSVSELCRKAVDDYVQAENQNKNEKDKVTA